MFFTKGETNGRDISFTKVMNLKIIHCVIAILT